MENQTSTSEKKNYKKYIPMLIVVAVVIIIGCIWYSNYSKYISTDDAYIESDNVSVSSKIPGRIIAEYVVEGDSVKKGMLLAELDSVDLQAQKNQVIAQKDQAIASKAQTEASYKYDEESVKVLKISLVKSQEDFNRAKFQFDNNVITKETFDHSKRFLETTQAQFEAAQIALEVSKAKIQSSASAVKSAEAQVALAESQLKNTKLYAFMDGIIAKRWLLPGDVTATGQSVFTITNNKKFWVMTYLEETKIDKINIGLEVRISVDAFSGVTFTGKIIDIGSNTASKFSLIAPNNASGNFTKVTQRVPVKISIENSEDGKPASSFRFKAGMSVVLKIIK